MPTHINPITGERTHLREDEEVDFISGRVVKKRPQKESPKQPTFSNPTQTYSPQIPSTGFDVNIERKPRKPLTVQEKHRIKILIALTILHLNSS